MVEDSKIETEANSLVTGQIPMTFVAGVQRAGDAFGRNLSCYNPPPGDAR
jgi:hypothetical protein